MEHIQHAVYGLVTEAGEIMDAWKRYIFYGTPLDIKNIKEELGDVLWYVALMCEATSTPLKEVMEANIRKLEVRYHGRFNSYNATSRDIPEEQRALDKEDPGEGGR